MEFRIIAGGTLGSAGCKNGDCPTVYVTDEHEDLIVQGYDLGDPAVEKLAMPNGESAVRIPRDVILAAAERIKEGA